MLRGGVVGGASSSAPAGTITPVPARLSHATADPHTTQNALHHRFALGSSKRRAWSSPRSHANCSGATKIFAACAEPVFLRQRLQWQYWNAENGGSIWNSIAPQTHEPRTVIRAP